MMGGAISGYWATGSVGKETPPAIMIRIAITHATMGRRMKKRLNTGLPPGGLWGCCGLPERGLDGNPGACPLKPVDDQPVRGRQAFEHDSLCSVEVADLDPAELDGLLVVDHECEPPGLIRQQRDIRHDRLLLRVEQHSDPHEQ